MLHSPQPIARISVSILARTHLYTLSHAEAPQAALIKGLMQLPQRALLTSLHANRKQLISGLPTFPVASHLHPLRTRQLEGSLYYGGFLRAALAYSPTRHF